MKKLPDFTVPPFIARVVARLPHHPPTFMLVTALNLGLGRIVPRESLAPLLGKRFKICVSDAGLAMRFAYTNQGFRVVGGRQDADLTITARSRDFIALLNREEDPDTLFFSRRLLTEGDTELGLLVKNTMDGVDLPLFNPDQPWQFLKDLRDRLQSTPA